MDSRTSPPIDNASGAAYWCEGQTGNAECGNYSNYQDYCIVAAFFNCTGCELVGGTYTCPRQNFQTQSGAPCVKVVAIDNLACSGSPCQNNQLQPCECAPPNKQPHLECEEVVDGPKCMPVTSCGQDSFQCQGKQAGDYCCFNGVRPHLKCNDETRNCDEIYSCGDSNCTTMNTTCTACSNPLMTDPWWSCEGGVCIKHPGQCGYSSNLECVGHEYEPCGGGSCEDGHDCACWPECVCFDGICSYTPIVIDVSGNGYNLTSAVNGVYFDFEGKGTRVHTAWTARDSDDAWLALDRNANGIIDSGKELFGSATPQANPPKGEQRNGFLALSEFDQLVKGGNRDGQIDSRDAVFSSLLLWQDVNHNGVSELGELRSLASVGLAAIELSYKISRNFDQNGNRFRYRARVRDARESQIAKWAWDVILTSSIF